MTEFSSILMPLSCFNNLNWLLPVICLIAFVVFENSSVVNVSDQRDQIVVL